MRPILNWQTFWAILRDDPPASSRDSIGIRNSGAWARGSFSNERALEMNRADVSPVVTVVASVDKKRLY